MTGALAGKALELAAQMLLVAAVPRVLGPSDYGVFALALAIVTVGSLSMSLGGPTLMSRFVPAVGLSERGAVARSLLLRLARWRALALGPVLVAAAVLVVAAPSAVPAELAFLVAAALVLDVAASLAFQTALALGRTTAWSFRWAAQNTTLVIAALGGYALAGVDGAVAGLVVGSGVPLVWGYALIRRPLAQAEGGFALPPGITRFGVLHSLGQAFNQLTNRGAIVSVALLAGSSVQTGFSALAIGIALAGTYAVWQLFTVQLPGLVEATRDETGPSQVEWSLRRLGTLSLAGALALAIAGVSTLQWTLPAVFGEDFAGAEAAAALALATLPLAPATAIATQAAALRLLPGLRAWSTGAGLVALVVTAGLAVPDHGAAGGSLALLVGTWVGVATSAFAFPSALGGRLLAASLGGSVLVLLVALAVGAL